MPTDAEYPDDLELTARERRALDSMLQAMATAIERRLPPTLELVGIGVHVARPAGADIPDAGVLH